MGMEIIPITVETAGMEISRIGQITIVIITIVIFQDRTVVSGDMTTIRTGTEEMVEVEEVLEAGILEVAAEEDLAVVVAMAAEDYQDLDNT